MKRAAALAAMLAATVAQASDDAQWYLQADNDVAFVSDRWYTSGVRIARSHRSAPDQRIEWGLVQEIYTPDTNHYHPNDRPYAARLFVSGARHDFSPSGYRTLEATLGMRGPAALGRQTQEAVHRVVPAPEDDWSRQLSNRVDVQAIYSQTQPFALWGRADAGFVSHYGAVLGNNVTFAHMGGEWRSGGAAQVPTSALRFAATPPVSHAAAGLSGFAGASARWVVRNTLLAGNADENALEIRRKRGVYRLAAGLAWTEPWGVVTFALVQDSREFETQHSLQRFGSLAVHLSFF